MKKVTKENLSTIQEETLLYHYPEGADHSHPGKISSYRVDAVTPGLSHEQPDLIIFETVPGDTQMLLYNQRTVTGSDLISKEWYIA